MIRLIDVGDYREIYPKMKDAPSLVPLLGDTPQPDEERIVAYLSSAQCLSASGYLHRDFFKPEKIIGSLSTRSDGTYVWPSLWAYYVATYHCRVPQEFVDHMQKKRWNPNAAL